MNNAEVCIVVEGQTEQTFVRDVLAPEMAAKGVFLHAALIGKPGHKGGNIRFDRARTDIVNFLKQRSDTFVSTMFDYFRIDSNWPGRSDIVTTLSAAEKAGLLERKTLEAIEACVPECDVKTRFIPYFGMHEFEALLFSNSAVLAAALNIEVSLIKTILAECGEPEEINEHPENAPSKRILLLNQVYRKVAMGKSIAKTIGITTMRDQCPHFNAWIATLEKLRIANLT
ncbi:MAG: hypothetical protein A2511_00400 [Deltaproteobacteria bacterium RIFOXYD12_FULL_50_9]|nr:MAG: hypothetical protein A2511_00400 [Deltaproteobacteria bacterium RIFOXYD12_FULL_50_9]